MPRPDEEDAAKALRTRLHDTRLFGNELKAQEKKTTRKPAKGRTENSDAQNAKNVREKAKAAARRRKAAAKAAACERGIGYDTKQEAVDVAHWASVTRGTEHAWILCDRCHRYHVIPVSQID